MTLPLHTRDDAMLRRLQQMARDIRSLQRRNGGTTLTDSDGTIVISGGGTIGPQGPEGPAGSPGPKGDKGDDGDPGTEVDGTVDHSVIGWDADLGQWREYPMSELVGAEVEGTVDHSVIGWDAALGAWREYPMSELVGVQVEGTIDQSVIGWDASLGAWREYPLSDLQGPPGPGAELAIERSINVGRGGPLSDEADSADVPIPAPFDFRVHTLKAACKTAPTGALEAQLRRNDGTGWDDVPGALVVFGAGEQTASVDFTAVLIHEGTLLGLSFDVSAGAVSCIVECVGDVDTATARALTVGVAGSLTSAADCAEVPIVVPFDMTLTKMRASVRAAPGGAMTVQLRRSTVGDTPVYSSVTGFLVTFTPGAVSTSAAPTAVDVDEGDVLNISVGTASGTNLIAELIGVAR